MAGETVSFKKSDDELQIVWSEVYAPNVPDSDDDFKTPVEVMKMAYRWMAKGKTHCIDINHDNCVTTAFVVESFIARKGDPDFIEGAWVAGVHIPDQQAWDMVKKGEINGFSIQGRATVGATVDLEMPGDVTGLTKTADDEEPHEHTFSVAYDDEGRFIGGVTDTVNGHFHRIVKGTVTEQAAGHRHNYDLVRGIISERAKDRDEGSGTA